MAEVVWRFGIPAKREDVEMIEQRTGFSLPSDYVDCVLKNNGGRPHPCAFDLEHRKAVVFEALLRVDAQAGLGTLRVMELLEGRLPASAVPIGRDPFGNLICLDFTDPGRCAIVFWDHEQEGVQGVSYVCVCFGQLLDLLYEPRQPSGM